MQSITAIVRNGRVELAEPVDWPDGAQVDVRLVNGRGGEEASSAESYRDFVFRLAGSFGTEPFERPPQGDFEEREPW